MQNQTPTPLGYPADELRDSAIAALDNAEQDLCRLLRYFRGNSWDASILEAVVIRMLSVRMTLVQLRPPNTLIEDPKIYDISEEVVINTFHGPV